MHIFVISEGEKEQFSLQHKLKTNLFNLSNIFGMKVVKRRAYGCSMWTVKRKTELHDTKQQAARMNFCDPEEYKYNI